MVVVEHNGIKFELEYGSEAYILDSAFWADMDKRYSKDELLAFVEKTHECYLKDDSHTPLGDLADYMAQNWEDLKEETSHNILNEFYSTL